MQHHPRNKKTIKLMKNNLVIVIAIIVVVLLVGGILYLRGNSSEGQLGNTQTGAGSGTAAGQPGQSMERVQIADVPVEKLPEGFPADVPLESGAEVTLNFQGTNANGEYQASREFVSKKSAEENFEYYQSVLKRNGWTIPDGGVIDDTARNQKIILASKGGMNMNIRIYTTVGQVRVALSSVRPQ